MGGGRTGLFAGTKGADSQQISLIPNPISVRHRGPNYDVEQGLGVGAGGNGGGIAIKDRTLLLTPPDVLKKCLHWRIGAISDGDLVRWIQGKLNDGRYRMVPPQLRPALVDYVSKLKSTRIAGKGYDTLAFLAFVTKLEEELEAMKQ